MPDTGAPWNIPYVESTDLVSDWPADSLALANAIDAGLDAAGGLVVVKSALFTGTQTASLTASANVAVTNLSITHEVADAANKLILMAWLGNGGTSYGAGNLGLGIYDGSSLLALGDAASSRTRVTASNRGQTVGTGQLFNTSATILHTPGTGSKTYTVRAINANGGTYTIYVNRGQADDNNGFATRSASGFVLMEVSV